MVDSREMAVDGGIAVGDGIVGVGVRVVAGGGIVGSGIVVVVGGGIVGIVAVVVAAVVLAPRAM